MGTGKQYDEEFKKQAIKLAKEIGTKAAADELCIPKGTLGTWVQKARIGEIDTGAGSRTPGESLTIAQQLQAANCIYRSDCHNCTDDLPHLAADCPRALPGKKRACLTSHQTGSCETHLMSLISFPDNQFHSHQVSL